MPARRLPREALLLLLAIGIAGTGSILLGQDANFDLLNYHLYNPWAWWTGRYGVDVAPALQSFHNPLVDLPFYLMVAVQTPPRVIAFALAVPAGIAAYFVWRIARLAFAALERPLATIAIAAAVTIGVSGPNARSMLGTTMNEWHTAALLMPALFVVVRELDRERMRVTVLLVAGLLAGAASGLKLTAAVYALALAVALGFARGGRRGLRDALVYSIGVLGGLAVTLAPWLVEVHALTGNPLFPYFNGVFGSPLLPPDWVFLKAFGPKSAVQWLTLPFDLLRPPALYVSEQRYRDARFPLVAGLALVLAVLAWGARTRTVGPAPAGRRALLRFGIAFLAVGFYLWAWVHGIHRYLLALEIVSGIAIVALTIALVPTRWQAATVIVVTVAVVATTRVPSWWRVPFGEAFLSVQTPAVAADTLVLLHGGPIAFLAPAFPPQVRFAGIANFLVDDRPSGLRDRIAALVAQHRGPLGALVRRDADPAPALASFGLAIAGPCEEVRQNLARFAIDYCPLARRAGSGSPAR